MKEKIISATIIAIGIIVLGLCLKGGIDNFANKDRKVSVKGLSEREVPADKVTWPILSKELGNDLPQLYSEIGVTQSKIKKFLISNGIKESEINNLFALSSHDKVNCSKKVLPLLTEDTRIPSNTNMFPSRT